MLSTSFVLAALALPVISSWIRTIRGSREFARNRLRYYANYLMLVRLDQQLRDSQTHEEVLLDLYNTEQALEAALTWVSDIAARFAGFAWPKSGAARRMPRVKHALLMSIVALSATCALVACQPPQSPQVMVAVQAATPGADQAATIVDENRPLVEALRGGGHVIYFRHGATNPNQTDSDPRNLANCATQRNLSDAGRAQAEAIGDAFRKLGIPVDAVLSSEYCRALEYSQLAFATPRPEQSLDLTDPLTDAQKTESAQVVKRLLATPPTSGSNTILVSHSPNLRLAIGVDLTTEGEAAVFRADGAGRSTLVARVLPTVWPVLAQALAAR